jgi:hypothetical protein
MAFEPLAIAPEFLLALVVPSNLKGISYLFNDELGFPHRQHLLVERLRMIPPANVTADNSSCPIRLPC